MYQQPGYGYQPQQTQALNYMRPMQNYPNMGSILSTAAALKGRPVASLDEVRAQTVDFDGSIFFFPNLGNNVIYTKQINPDGTANLNAYQLVEMPVQQQVAPTPSMDSYVTKEEFNAAIQDLLSKIPTAAPTVKSEEVVLQKF